MVSARLDDDRAGERCVFVVVWKPAEAALPYRSVLMDNELIGRAFQRMGAEVRVEPLRRDRWSNLPASSVDVRSARGRERFLLRLAPETRAEVVDVRPQWRHLLLMLRTRDEKPRFLCGHDERAWFVAAIPEAASAADVPRAIDALKPEPVRNAMERAGVDARLRLSRRNAAFLRQGEWFFLPRPDLEFAPLLWLAREPLQRGRGKPHIAEWAVRRGGESVWVSPSGATVLTELERARRLRSATSAERSELLLYRFMRRDPEVFVRGRIRHPDHKTLHLSVWHEVVMNTETQAVAMQNVAFLD